MIQKHWNLKYIYDRIALYFFEKRHKELPWMPKKAIHLLEDYLNKEQVGVEFGSGRSSAWYAERVQHLTSVEDHKEWYNTVKKDFEEKQLSNVTYLLKSAEGDIVSQTDYCLMVHEFEKESLDFAIVDGKHRDVLSLALLPKIKRRGFLLLDDAHRYLPSNTNAPHSIKQDISKITENWKSFQEEIIGWETLWVTNGVTDTAFFIKK